MTTDCGGIPNEVLQDMENKFSADPKNRLAQNVCYTANPKQILKNQSSLNNQVHVFSCKVPTEGKPMSNQKASGRCWIFACLNAMRCSVMPSLQCDELEFSQNYLFFWDKLERCNYNLDSYIECARRGETFEGRLVSHLLTSPSEDGGQWDMLVNLVEKYGVIPKVCFKDAQSAAESRILCGIINNKMREFCKRLQTMVFEKASDEEIQKEKSSMLQQIYTTLSICLGTPPKTITWEYYDKSKKYQKIGPITPLEFYTTKIKPIFNMQDKLCIVNDPRAKNPYNKLYTVEYLNNMTGGRPVLYVNQPIGVLKELTMKSIADGEAVWFGCDVGKYNSIKPDGILDLKALDYNLVFGFSALGLDKEGRLNYGESLMTHAMLITAFHKENGESTKWRIENSWGDSDGDKGYLIMSDDWFSEFVYEVVIDKKFLTEEILAVTKQTPVVLPAWDPMGALAKL
ncbi:bleomycin hydrolase-like [Crassostrea angulata]|uniref:bleomycin hydrolase-like n=1 Tax=Magallana angulata TaxID=2784310 RepID=UPI0022B20B26|nr:bleomycin hydrolase-like [Crassostrea angulata]